MTELIVSFVGRSMDQDESRKMSPTIERSELTLLYYLAISSLLTLLFSRALRFPVLSAVLSLYTN